MFRKPCSLSGRILFLICTLGILSALLLPVSARPPEAAAASEKKTEGADPIHILLIGQDRREEDTVSRADSILLCTFHPEDAKIIITSFLRDLYVPIPGYPSNRLNAAYAHGGMSLLRQTLEENFAVPIDGCIEVDFNQFAQVLDILGGVTIVLRQDEADTINEAVPGELTAGSQKLNGSQALAYTRIRKLDEDGDFSRTNRQRNVISALLGSYQEASLLTVLSIIPKVMPMLSTDMEQRQVVATIIQLLPMLSSCTVRSQQIPAADAYSFETIRGMSVLTADLEEIRQNLAQILSPGNEN